MAKLNLPEAADSPSRAAKREALVSAAVAVLRNRGLAGCTARAIAAASPLTKSALHYYFRDTDEIIDLAFRRLIGQYLERIAAAAKDEPTGPRALWAAASTYLHLGSSQRAGQVPMLWFEVQLAASRKGDTGTVGELTRAFLDDVIRIVADAGASDSEAKGRVLLSSLIGIIIRDSMEPLDLDEELELTLRATGLPVERPPSS